MGDLEQDWNLVLPHLAGSELLQPNDCAGVNLYLLSFNLMHFEMSEVGNPEKKGV